VLAKLPSSEEATRSLANQTETLRILTSIPGLAEWQAILPVSLAHGEIDGQPFVIERMLPGRDARLALTNPEVTHIIRTCAADTIGELHQRTARLQEISTNRLVDWIDTPLALVRQAIAWMPGGKNLLPATNRLSAELHEAFHGRQYALSWTHGDFVLGNILVRPEDQAITGIIDWELASPGSLPGLDIVQLLVSTRREVAHAEIGKLVADLIRERSTWNMQELELLESAQQNLPGDAPTLRPLLLLFWLQHVGSNLSKSVRYSRHIWWIYNNLRPVLRDL
jgi:aminoglycoside phosphotransferase (APT) family kinase protein